MPKETWKCDFLGLGLVGGEMAVVLCSGLGAGFRNLEQERVEDQHEVRLELVGSACSSTRARLSVV